MAACLLLGCNKEPGGGGGGGGGGDVPVPATIFGNVISASGIPLEGVVVSDGQYCCKTKADGTFELAADLKSATYVFVSTPSEYAAPVDEANKCKPVFYKKLSDIGKSSDGTYRGVTFKLNKISNPNHCAVLMYADPQPRKHYTGKTRDNVGYYSLDCCKDLYNDLKATRESITDKAVYGVCLGDLVHEDMSLFSSNSGGNHLAGMNTSGAVTYNIIGNHDYNTSKDTADEGGADFEKNFGPRYYSFNLAGVHWVVLENLQMYKKDGKLSSYNNGLSDREMTWLTNDLSMVDRNTTICVCAHAPMFYNKDKDASGSAIHGKEYKAALSRFAKVYSWGGHAHTTYNRAVSGETIESHVLHRCTGELWVNDYLSENGTPRGYLVLSLDDGDVKWQFHPTSIQTARFGTNIAKPGYEWRDWNYNSDGVAYLKSTNKRLDGSYQMRVYPPTSYGNTDKNVYVNVFYYDEQWSKPTITFNGGTSTMTKVGASASNNYDRALQEIREHYTKITSYSEFIKDYTWPTGCPVYSLFYKNVGNATGPATISVTDRFGNKYETTIEL